MRNFLVIIALAVGLYFIFKPSELPKQVDLTATPETQEVLAVKETQEIKNAETTPVAEKTTASVSDAASESNEALARSNMTFMLNKLSECTEIKNSASDANAEPTLQTVLDSVQSDLGEPVIRSEDWNSTEVLLNDGSRRIIRMETVYEDDDIVKKLKYYQVGEQGLTPLELTREQSINPNDSFLASLEKEGEVINREKSERVFFQNGEEVMFVEKNGKILNSEIIRAGKSLKCGEFGQQSFRCQCF